MSKTYLDHMNGISAKELYKGLLAHGLFADKLPPLFTSEPFYTYCESLSSAFEDKPRQYVHYESLKNTNVPRGYGIPNPMAYQRLCRCLADNWESLKAHFEQQTAHHRYKISRIHIRKIAGQRALFKMNYKNWRVDDSPEADLLIGKKYMVTADISTCFPSIYTHSIPWALVGKEAAKANRRSKEWYNEIDRCCQNSKYGETHGLLIGPHCSNLLSEIILTSVDKRLYDKDWEYIRNIDDYCCYVPTFESGQRFLSELGEELRRYDLSLNHKKTAIKELPIATKEQWVRQINAMLIMRAHKNVLNYKDIQAYLDAAVGLMKENNMNSAILNYTIKTLKGVKLTKNAEQYYIKTVFHLAIVYPYLISLIEECVLIQYDIDEGLRKKFVETIFDDGLRTANYEAICYAIYFAIKYEVVLNGLDVNHVIEKQNCLYKIFAWQYFSTKKDNAALKLLRSHAESLRNSAENFDANWLFTYEVLPQTKLTSDWKAMKKAGVSFIADLSGQKETDSEVTP